MTNDADVIVIGGGPAGGTAAYYLAAAGHKVMLLEKATLPRDKLCSGVITQKSAEWLSDMIDLNKVLIGSTRYLQVGMDARGHVHRSPDARLRFARRRTMDYSIVHAASRAGADVQDRTPVLDLNPLEGTVTVSGHMDPLRAKVIIGADGVLGVTSRKLNFGQIPQHAVGIETAVKDGRGIAPQSRPAIVRFLREMRGYYWAFPKRDGTVGVGAGTLSQRPSDHKRLQYITRRMTQEMIGTKIGRQIPGYLIPIWQQPLVQIGRTMLTGDAAGLVDSLIAEGIAYALWSGRIAAVAAHQHLMHGMTLGTYPRELQQQIGRWQRPMRAVSMMPILPQMMNMFSRPTAMRRRIYDYLIARTPISA